MSEQSDQGRNVGKIIEIKGVVIDAVFPDGLPEIFTALEIERPRRARSSRRCSSTSATTASAPSRWTRPTGSRAASTSSTPARRSPCPSGSRRSGGSGT